MTNNEISESPITADPSQPIQQSEVTSGEQSDAKFKASFSEYQKEIVSLKTDIAETKRMIEQSKDKNIEALGLFVALFTFISIEFSLFREIKDFNAAVSITLIVAGLLIFFVLILHLVIISSGNNTSKWVKFFYIFLFSAVIALILLGINFNNYFKKMDYPIKALPNTTASPSATMIPSPSY